MWTLDQGLVRLNNDVLKIDIATEYTSWSKGLQSHLCLIKDELHKPSLFRHFSSANGCQNPPLRPLYRLQFSSIDNGKQAIKPCWRLTSSQYSIPFWSQRLRQCEVGLYHKRNFVWEDSWRGDFSAVGCTGKGLGQVIGLLFGTSYLSRQQGLANIANCEHGKHPFKSLLISKLKVCFANRTLWIEFLSLTICAGHMTDPEIKWQYPSEVVGRNYQQSQVRRAVKKLWVPSLCVLTISLGWHYPLSLLLNLLFLMWSTKPTPSSIYLWVEQVWHQNSSLLSQISGLFQHVKSSSVTWATCSANGPQILIWNWKS